jgi:hypothetical protein
MKLTYNTVEIVGDFYLEGQKGPSINREAISHFRLYVRDISQLQQTAVNLAG